MSTTTGTAGPTAAVAGDEETATAGIAIRGLSKSFTRQGGEQVRAVDDVSLDVAQGELLVLLGPSGCGKTTLLRLLAGLEQAERGTVSIGGTVVFDGERGVDVPPENRPAGMVFQSYALWPHMTAFDNVAYPLRSRKVGKAEVGDRVGAVLEMMGIGDLGRQHPAQLSGGQQQRVALARAVVAGDRAILFDEPLSNVDAKVRDVVRLEILRLQRELDFTAVYVTHDQEEAMTLGTRIAVLDAGRVAQVGRPRDVYERPTSRYVANFVGAADELEGRVVRRDGARVVVETGVGRLAVDAASAPDADEVVVVLRPEAWRPDPPAEAPNRLEVEVEAAVFLGGGRTEYLVRADEQRLRVWDRDAGDRAAGSTMTLGVAPDAVLLFPRG